MYGEIVRGEGGAGVSGAGCGDRHGVREWTGGTDNCISKFRKRWVIIYYHYVGTLLWIFRIILITSTLRGGDYFTNWFGIIYNFVI